MPIIVLATIIHFLGMKIGGQIIVNVPRAAKRYDFCPDQANVLAAFIVEAPDYSRNAEGRTDFK